MSTPGHDELSALRERAKELRCHYAVNAALGRRDAPLHAVFSEVLAALPPAWQFDADACARIEYFGRTHAGEGYAPSAWALSAPLKIWQTPVGLIEVHYRQAHPDAFEGPFLREERELLDSVAHRLGEYLEWRQRELGGERVGADPEHWRWRQRFAERIASAIDPARFGVRALYLHGSTEQGNAAAGSDIDLLVVHDGDARTLADLRLWLEGWSLCLAELRAQLQGLPSEGLLDVHYAAPDEAERLLRAAARTGDTYRPLALGPHQEAT